MRIKLISLSPFLILVFAPGVYAHPGRVNSSGCHTNRSTGEYHCHSGGGRSAPPTPAPAYVPTCRNISQIIEFATLVRGGDKTTEQVTVKNINANLDGMPGSLSSFQLSTNRVRIWSSKSNPADIRFSFDNSSWIPVASVNRSRVTVYNLSSNSLMIDAVERRSEERVSQICK